MNTRKMVASLGFAIALAGCDGWTVSSDSYATNDIVFDDPSGVIGGVPWSMSTAVARRDGDKLDVQLFADSIPPCSAAASDKPMITFRVPAAVETYSVDSFQPLTFVEPPDQRTNANGGFIDVTSLSETRVFIGIIAGKGDAYSVNGTLVAEICP